MPGWWDDLFDRPAPIERGLVRPAEEAGIGARFGEDAAATLRRVR
jgi:L-alanine-DL-glutamate epimerase-like enolase superfamily enzyme